MGPTRSAWRSVSAACLLAACGAQHIDAPSNAPERDAGLRGLAYAQQACASCHAVARGQALSPVAQAPAFETVANTPGMTGLALNVWLHSPHENMPHLIVEPDHIDDLWAHISSLRRDEPGL